MVQYMYIGVVALQHQKDKSFYNFRSVLIPLKFGYICKNDDDDVSRRVTWLEPTLQDISSIHVWTERIVIRFSEREVIDCRDNGCKILSSLNWTKLVWHLEHFLNARFHERRFRMPMRWWHTLLINCWQFVRYEPLASSVSGLRTQTPGRWLRLWNLFF